MPRSPWISPRTLSLLAGLLLAAGCRDPAQSPLDAGPADASTDSTIPDAGPPRPDSGGCTLDVGLAQDLAAPPIHTPRWAFSPWISKDISDAKDTYDFVQGFASRDIPVGALVIDSPWETNYNTFVPNPKRYPQFQKLINDMHARGIKVVLWTTQMMNSGSFDLEAGGDTYDGPAPGFEAARRCGFYVNEGTTYPWWKGLGAGVDFFNPRAVAWWRGLQDTVLKMGIDGWKLDFGESYIGGKTVSTHAGTKSFQAYSEAYYRDFLAHGVAQRGKGFTTMVRGYDKSYQFEGRFFARPEHAPVVWAGDNRRDWIGLADALDHIFRSAQKGYVVVGSDIGGYLDFDDKDSKISVPFDQDNFVRWVAVGAMTPFMQLHGRANLAPWTVKVKPTETVAIYRYWAWLHQQMVPFWYSLAEEAYKAKTGLLRPIGAEAQWPGDYRFVVGQAFLVAPLLDGSGKRDVALPAGSSWYDWWKPADPPLSGGQTLKAYDASDQRRIPLFVKEGAIVPLTVENSITGIGSKAFSGHLTLLVYPPADGASSAFVLHEEDDKTTTIGAARSGSQVTLTLSRTTQPVVVRLRRETAASAVSLDGKALGQAADQAALLAGSGGWRQDSAARAVWIKLPKRAATKVTVTVQ